MSHVVEAISGSGAAVVERAPPLGDHDTPAGLARLERLRPAAERPLGEVDATEPAGQSWDTLSVGGEQVTGGRAPSR